MFQEPQHTQFDLKWWMFGIHVRVHPLFWLITAMLGWWLVEALGLQYLLIWVLCVFVSILLHEMGHVFAMRLFGGDGHIVLFAFYGLAIPNRTFPSRWQRIFVSFAGPLAQFVLFGLLWPLNWHLHASGTFFSLPPMVRAVLVFLLDINWYWPLINLFPIWPLDGGQISRELFVWWMPWRGVRASLILSIVVCALVAINSVWSEFGTPPIPFLAVGGRTTALFFAIFGINNILELSQMGPSGGRRQRWDDETADRLPWERDADWWKKGGNPYD
jgi:Zn-dependent protease